MKWMKLGNKPWKNEGFYNLQVFLSDQSPNIALPCRKSLNRWPCWDLTESVPLVLWLSKSRNLSLPCTQLWQLKLADDNFDSFPKLSIVLTVVTSCKQFGQLLQAVNSFDSFFKLLSFAKQIQAQVWPRFWIMMNWILDLSTLLHGLVKNVSLFTKQNQAYVWPRFWV